MTTTFEQQKSIVVYSASNSVDVGVARELASDDCRGAFQVVD
jgi:hypothetical protein